MFPFQNDECTGNLREELVIQKFAILVTDAECRFHVNFDVINQLGHRWRVGDCYQYFGDTEGC